MTRRLLLVDDAPDIRTIVRLSLERLGDWTVIPVDGGQMAVHVARQEGPFDAVLLDVMMPGIDGPTTLAQLRADGLPATVPIVFLTAKAQAAERERLLSLPVAGVIEKPFDPLALPVELERLLKEAHAAQSP
jgi:two-component system, OmpR family, response regulator